MLQIHVSGVLEFLITNPNRNCKFLYNRYYTFFYVDEFLTYNL